MNLHERAQAVVRYLAKKNGQNQYEIGRQIGYTNKSSFSMLLNGKMSFPDSIPERIAALDPSINIEFLKGTSDQMLLDAEDQPLFIPEPEPRPQEKPPVPMGVYVPGELVQMFSDLSATVRAQQETIRDLIGRHLNQD